MENYKIKDTSTVKKIKVPSMTMIREPNKKADKEGKAMSKKGSSHNPKNMGY